MGWLGAWGRGGTYVPAMVVGALKQTSWRGVSGEAGRGIGVAKVEGPRSWITRRVDMRVRDESKVSFLEGMGGLELEMSVLIEEAHVVICP